MHADTDSGRTERLALALLAGACLALGLVARFQGLGKWPLAIDEYYFARSVQNVLHSGLPQFPCGGLYLRGLLLQYLCAALELAGLSPELAPRLVAALSSLLALPAVFILARRLGGRSLGLIAVAILALSVWEVEIGRLGRMYAPFQALFVWYLVFFLSYTIDRKDRSLAPMLVLSWVGVLVWEGGLLLALANLLPPFIRNPSGRFGRRDWLYLLAQTLSLLPIYWIATENGRSLIGPPPLPADYQPALQSSPSRLDAAVMPWTTLALHPLWALAALLPAGAALYAGIRLVRARIPPLATLGSLVALACALLQQFALAAAVVLLLLLLRIVDWRDLVGRPARGLQLALLASLIFWSAFGLNTADWHAPGPSAPHLLLLLGYEFARFPDLVREIAVPWARTVPLLAVALAVLIGAACLRAILRPGDTAPAERVLLLIFVALLLAAGASHPPRHETRYVFFLYPLAVVIALTMLARAAHALLPHGRLGGMAAALLCFGGFALSEDFRPSHLWNIDSEAINFRLGMSPYQIGHYHPRSDVRAAAIWLAAHVSPARDVVIVSFPGVDFYYPDFDFYFVTDADPRFHTWACQRGTIQRWSNRPLMRTAAALAAEVATGRRVWVVLESNRVQSLLSRFPTADWRQEWSSKARDITIVSFHHAQPLG